MAKRNSKGQFVKKGGGGKKKAARAKAPAKRNPPARKRKPAKRRRKSAWGNGKPGMNPPARRRRTTVKRSASGRFVRRNPPAMAVNDVVASAGAAFVGGLVSVAATAVFERLTTDQSARDIASVVIPSMVGIAATQLNSAHGQAAAAGAFGVAGLGIAKAVAKAVVAKNPPRVPWNWNRNPPVVALPLVPGALPSAWSSPIRAMASGM